MFSRDPRRHDHRASTANRHTALRALPTGAAGHGTPHAYSAQVRDRRSAARLSRPGTTRSLCVVELQGLTGPESLFEDQTWKMTACLPARFGSPRDREPSRTLSRSTSKRSPSRRRLSTHHKACLRHSPRRQGNKLENDSGGSWS